MNKRRFSVVFGLLMFIISINVVEFYVSPHLLSSLGPQQVQNGWSVTADLLHPQMVSSADVLKVATRLQKRIAQRYHRHYAIEKLQDALVKRFTLFQRDVRVEFKSSDGKSFDPWVISLSAYPQWLRADVGDTFAFKLDSTAIAASYAQKTTGMFTAPIDSTISAIQNDGKLFRVTTDHPAEAGYVVDAKAVETIRKVLLGNDDTLTIPVTYTPGRVLNATGQNLGKLWFLSAGRSNFAGSGGGRISNVRKGLAQFVNDVLVPPGAVVSFNDMVHNMSASDGWEDALVIVNGTDLQPFPGGGICQVATTTYRAALLAGLPIIDRANHSLYVSYYEKYGVGIDATIYPYRQDLTFRNDTGNFVLIEAYYHGFEATVNFYGTPDGRVTTMEGPFFSTNASSDLTSLLQRTLSDNEIAWIRHLQLPDGSKKSEVIVSKYLSIPRKLHEEYAKNILLSSLVHE